MRRGVILPLAVALLAQGVVHARGAPAGNPRQPFQEQELARLNDLCAKLRALVAKAPGGVPRASDELALFKQIARVKHPEAVRRLKGYARDPAYAHLVVDMIELLAGLPDADDVMLEHLLPDDPSRRTAREYLITRAKLRRDERWLMLLFSVGTKEDCFIALKALGEISSAHVLEYAETLMRDEGWTPDESGIMSCGTIAASLRHAEGQPAARTLLLLMGDSRFGPADAAELREATRLWRQADLRTYIDLNELTHTEAARREDLATFLGTVGLESARAPLLRLLGNVNEPPNVRGAAAAALGGLRIARGDLAAQLRPLLASPEEPLRAGAIRGLGRLKVKQAAAALVSMMGGPHESEGRAALSRLTGLPATTDWVRWLEKCDLPEGT